MSTPAEEKSTFRKDVELSPPTEQERQPIKRDNAINASGHQQELDRNFGLFSIVGLAITSGNAWIALGGSIVSYRTCITARVRL